MNYLPAALQVIALLFTRAELIKKSESLKQLITGEYYEYADAFYRLRNTASA